MFGYGKILKENARERKQGGKLEIKKSEEKKKVRFKVNKLFLYVTSNSFYLF